MLHRFGLAWFIPGSATVICLIAICCLAVSKESEKRLGIDIAEMESRPETWEVRLREAARN